MKYISSGCYQRQTMATKSARAAKKKPGTTPSRKPGARPGRKRVKAKTAGPAKPEILAPAGSLECFHAALDAGADAVYVGLPELNARIRAKNFTIKTLSYVVPYAHKHKIKVQVALNTLVKQHELRPLLTTLHQLQQIGIDALIVQDLGLAHIVREHFPRLALHASTQMAIHNTLGIQAARDAGFERAILARELTSREIEYIRRSTDMELEVFVHGALCYCISGLCLASSFLGGQSGNRGRCTQVCRRRFSALEKSGFYFSPKDLSLVDHVHQLARIGINSLKIEGRMKSAEYVHTVVSAYRAVLDTPEKLEDIKEGLAHDFGREKTTLYFNGFGQTDIIEPAKPSGTGLFLGTVSSVRGNAVTVRTAFRLEPGDRLRFHGEEGFEGDAARIDDVKRESFRAIVKLKQDIEAGPGSFVYLTGRKSAHKGAWSKEKISGTPARFANTFPGAARILKKYGKAKTAKPDGGQDRLYLRIDNVEWLHQLS
ncbi:MAG: hypothetical protein GF418_06080, partial [Chitinivibrionales bacterium]|nr:hypothetical protein [Chitinivibrionales bacterium]MBD3395179.1 hypothetical protein [Chitinivibrionales bacterium]